jgi:hypothetical protein
MLMKKSILITALVAIAVTGSFAQSKTFQTIKHKFQDEADVHSFHASGFLARTILWMAGEHEFRDAITDVHNVRLITVPKTALEARKLSLKGLKKFIEKDSFEPMLLVKEHGDEVTLYLQEGGSPRLNRYLLLIDNSTEVVAIEIKGYIDMEKLSKHSQLSLHENSEM